MFDKFFSTQKISSPTGFFKTVNTQFLPLPVLPEEGSINDVIASLGYHASQIHTVLTFDSQQFFSVGVKILTRDVVMAQTKENNLAVSKADLEKTISSIDWNFEYASHRVEDMLQAGIDEKTLTIEFLRSVTTLTKESDNLYKSDRFQLFLEFDNELLINFTSADLANTATKWLKQINPQMVQHMLEEARSHHATDFDAMEEVNHQCDALQGLPEAINNPFLQLHMTPAGNFGFFNALITHYEHPCSLDDFLLVNKGRHLSTGNNTFMVGRFIYAFDESGQLASKVNLD